MKNKEWLKEKVDRLFFDNSMSNNPFLVAKREAITEISNLIDQLDEPKVLSQEWIDRHAEHYEYIGYAGVPVDDLQNLLVPKQKLPVIPQFVADYYNDSKKYELTFAEWFEFPEFGQEGKIADKTFEWLLDNSHEVNIERQFILADIIAHGLDGYEVEKEKRYYIIDEMDNATLMTFDLSDETGKEIIEFVVGYSENGTIHFDSKEKAELIARFVGDSVKVEELEE